MSDENIHSLPRMGKYPESKVEHNIAMRLKDETRKFYGAIGEFLHDYMSDFMKASRDYEISQQQKLLLMNNILAGDAKIFFYSRVEGIETELSHAVKMLDEEYNYIVRQEG